MARSSRLPPNSSPSLFAEPEPETPIVFAPGIHAGTSGWAYPTWKPGFYPPKLPAKRFLEHYAAQLNSVEVNYTFRMLPSATMLAGWLAATPQDFRFSFKAPQRITHFRLLNQCEEAVEQFVTALEPVRAAAKLGTLLFQLPPSFKANPERLATFLASPALNSPAAPMVAFEFRHKSWFTEETYDILRAHNATLCVAESDDLQSPEVHCAKTHACFRLRRTAGYSPEEIDALAEKFMALATNADVYVYFKHEDDPTGALNAVALLAACAAKAAER